MEVSQVLDVAVIVGLAMGVINVIKAYLPRAVVPFAAVALGTGLAALDAALFGGVVLEAARNALVATAIAVGLYVGGDVLRVVTPLRSGRRDSWKIERI